MEQPPANERAIATLVSVNIGLPRDVEWQGRTVHTGVWKAAVDGPAMVRRLNIDGDGQGDLAGHGGEQRAVLVYQLESYAYWEDHFGRHDFEYGQFGENLTVDGLPDDDVCIGDRYRIGDAEFEVTQPRVTCYRVGMRLGEPDLPALLVAHHRPGFYMRVIHEGRIAAGDAIVKTRTGPGRLTVSETDALLYLPDRDHAQLQLALQIPALSPGWQQSFRDLLAGAADANSTPVRAPEAWSGFRPLRVTQIVAETDTVSSISFGAPDGSALPSPRAGQFLTLRIAGAAEPAPVRSYSLSAPTENGTYRISVKHEPNGVASTFLHEHLRVDAIVEVAAPRGDFVLDDTTAPVLFVSAGIGVTPELAMLYELASRQRNREVWWIHGARRPAEHALAAEAHALLASLPNAHEHIFYSTATEAECRAMHARPGRVGLDALRTLAPPSDASAYVCGPPAFMTDVRAALLALGVDAARIHIEVFGALAPVNPGVVGEPPPAPHQPAGPARTGPLVTFARSGLSTRFGTDVASVLELAEACAVSARWSCRSGVCHTCITPVLSGTVSYDPVPLEAPAAGDVLICCSRPTTDLVLDM